ncbi:DUF3455 domain-containing protein [Laribacter hongkongensis]|uniref:DUF3455 domain-containing protein n=1 Tax=Laribacter hongkongensis TaxID=168471 RepID=UPI001EFE18CA|nr:DUF3455 domain-containing protein [Laribacter hongkongensis]MCG9076137.1 DUF3455 domain-containing protein [Laribacter hongkongensis]
MSITIRKLPYPVVLLVALATWQAHADNVMLPEQIRVPAGSKEIAAMHAVGDLTYECKVQANDASAYSWQVLGPEAQLSAKNGKMKGRYYGPPATWEGADGSKVVAAQQAVAPNGAGNIPLQLAKATQTSGNGVFSKVQFVQRLDTVGGTAPNIPCSGMNVGTKHKVGYSADYVFWQ